MAVVSSRTTLHICFVFLGVLVDPKPFVSWAPKQSELPPSLLSNAIKRNQLHDTRRLHQTFEDHLQLHTDTMLPHVAVDKPLRGAQMPTPINGILVSALLSSEHKRCGLTKATRTQTQTSESEHPHTCSGQKNAQRTNTNI